MTLSEILDADRLGEALDALDPTVVRRLAATFRALREDSDLPDHSATDEFVAGMFLLTARDNGLTVGIEPEAPIDQP